MQKITISMDEILLARAQEHARQQGMTFNQFVRDLVAKELASNPGSRTRTMFELADGVGAKSKDGPLKREDSHFRT
jgi:hypothetical protein